MNLVLLPYRRIILIGLIVFLAIFTAGCPEPKISPEEAQAYLDTWTYQVQPHLLEKADGAASSTAMKTQVEKVSSTLTEDDKRLHDAVLSVYKNLDYQPQLIKGGALTERGVKVWETLSKVEDHALDGASYNLETIGEKLAQLQTKREHQDSFNELIPNEAEKQFITDYLLAQTATEFDLSEGSYAAMTELLFKSPQGKRLQDSLKKYEQMLAGRVSLEAEVEQLLAHNIARYAHELRYFRIKEIFIHPRNDDFWNEQEIRRPRPDTAKGSYQAGVTWRRAAAVAEAFANDKDAVLAKALSRALTEILSGETGEALAKIPPQNPQYMGLLKERQRYQTIVQNGGWESITPVNNLRAGMQSKTVEQLKERLQKEHYYPEDAPVDEQFDDLLTDAIRAYQETHQMLADGKAHAVFWRSLNIPAERRLAQIELNLIRWRSTNVRHENPIYTYINVADYNVEIWQNQKREMRFAVVVGSNEKSDVIDSDEQEYANRTPTPLAAYIDRVIYNPYWNVTARIRMVRILPEVKKSLEAKYKARLDKMQAQAKAKSSPVKSAMNSMLASVTNSDRDILPMDDGDETVEAAAKNPLYSKASEGDGYTFHVDAIRALAQTNVESEKARYSDEQLLAMFPYIDLETGIIDVNTTNPEHIPEWYEENRYEVVFGGNNWEYVRMLPGPENSLGYVKVIFPNYHDVYLHDTPAKDLFSRSVRAFSHGCIRMEDPLGLSEFLLKQDGSWEKHDIPGTLKSGDYLPVFLDRQVPVYLEYYTVHVDDEGRANFLADVYNYDTF